MIKCSGQTARLWLPLALIIGLLSMSGCQSAVDSSVENTTAVTQTAAPDVAPTPTTPATPAVDSAQRASADADVRFVEARATGPDTWTFSVTVAHPDTGWEDYADGWDVVLPDGTVVKPDPESPFTRLLLHPHVNEQPFTRSQSGIFIPPDVLTVTVRAHDLVDGFGGREVVVDLTTAAGADFEVLR